jgi:hypothetical protein
MILSIDINEWINIKSMILARVFLFDQFLGERLCSIICFPLQTEPQR